MQSWKTVQRVFEKLKIELPCNLAMPLLGIYPKEIKSESRKDICTPMFIAEFFLNSQDTETTQVFMNGRMNKDGMCICILKM